MKINKDWKWIYKGRSYTCMTDAKETPEFHKDGQYWSVDEDATIIEIPYGISDIDLGKPEDSLHQIINGELVKYKEVPEDGEPVVVRMFFWHGREERRISSGKLTPDGKLLCYFEGGTKFTSEGKVVAWECWRRPTPKELKN